MNENEIFKDFRLAHTMLRVLDLDTSLKFYQFYEYMIEYKANEFENDINKLYGYTKKCVSINYEI